MTGRWDRRGRLEGLYSESRTMVHALSLGGVLGGLWLLLSGHYDPLPLGFGVSLAVAEPVGFAALGSGGIPGICGCG